MCKLQKKLYLGALLGPPLRPLEQNGAQSSVGRPSHAGEADDVNEATDTAEDDETFIIELPADGVFPLLRLLLEFEGLTGGTL